jgi:hypothetical protein
MKPTEASQKICTIGSATSTIIAPEAMPRYPSIRFSRPERIAFSATRISPTAIASVPSWIRIPANPIRLLSAASTAPTVRSLARKSSTTCRRPICSIRAPMPKRTPPTIGT